MAVETPVEVVAVRARSVLLKSLGSCVGCGGCGGRCGLGWGEQRTLSLPRSGFGDLAVPGRRLWLRSEAAGLRDRAVLGYGIPLAGLVLGASAGHALGWLLAGPLNAMAAVGALAGTLCGILGSNRTLRRLPRVHAIEVRAAEPIAGPDGSFTENS